jgi:hypothetical protein
MTPEDRADKIIPPGCGVSNDDENLDFMRQEIAAAVRAAVAEEREACARLVTQYDATDEDGRFLADLGEWVGLEARYLPDAEKIATTIRARGEGA